MKPTLASTRIAGALATLLAFASAAAGGVALGGCGASATLDPVARAAEVTSRQSGARFTLSMRFSSAALPGGTFAIDANGYLDERRKAVSMSIDLSHVPGSSQLPGAGAEPVRMIFQYPVIYMDLPFLAGKLPEGKTWVKLDLVKTAQAAGIDLSQLSSVNESDPTQFLAYLRASSGHVSTVGSEKVDGVPSTHYRATLELSRILDRLPDDERAVAKKALERFGGSDSFPVDVWVDAQGRVRRELLTLSTLAGASGTPGGSGAAGASASVTGSVAVDFTHYGAVPAIVPPPASEVFDEGAAGAQGAGGSGF